MLLEQGVVRRFSPGGGVRAWSEGSLQGVGSGRDQKVPSRGWGKGVVRRFPPGGGVRAWSEGGGVVRRFSPGGGVRAWSEGSLQGVE
uniref:Uncharacterized protein n=1 Tax=Knipowitschia caucasica TaxID=637954 RepID=A0AAV2M2U8_KNICA